MILCAQVNGAHLHLVIPREVQTQYMNETHDRLIWPTVSRTYGSTE